MSKLLMLLVLLSLSACIPQPKFKVGDCIREPLNPNIIFQIINIGRYGYVTLKWNPYYKQWISFASDVYFQVDLEPIACPKETK